MAEATQVKSVTVSAPQNATGIETEAAKAAHELDSIVRQAEVAAREWGVRPDHLEGRFISALLAAITWLGRLIQASAADQRASAKDNRIASAADLEKIRVASHTAEAVLNQAKTAYAGSEVQIERVVSRFVDSVAPQVSKAIAEAVVIRERDYNKQRQWGRAAAVGGLLLALVVGGNFWGSWQSGQVADGARALEKIKQCQAAPVKDTRTGNAFCLLKDLLAPA